MKPYVSICVLSAAKITTVEKILRLNDTARLRDASRGASRAKPRPLRIASHCFAQIVFPKAAGLTALRRLGSHLEFLGYAKGHRYC